MSNIISPAAPALLHSWGGMLMHTRAVSVARLTVAPVTCGCASSRRRTRPEHDAQCMPDTSSNTTSSRIVSAFSAHSTASLPTCPSLDPAAVPQGVNLKCVLPK